MFENVNRLKLLLFIVLLVTTLFFYFLGLSHSINTPKSTINGAIIIIIMFLLIFLIDVKYPNVTRRFYEWDWYSWDSQTRIEGFFLGLILIIITAITELKFSWIRYIYPVSIEISFFILFLFVVFVVFAFGELRQKHKTVIKRIH